MDAYADIGLRMSAHYVDMSQKEIEYDGGSWWKEEGGYVYISRHVAGQLIGVFSLCCSCWLFGGASAGTAAVGSILRGLGCSPSFVTAFFGLVSLDSVCASAWDAADGDFDGWCRVGRMDDQSLPIGP